MELEDKIREYNAELEMAWNDHIKRAKMIVVELPEGVEVFMGVEMCNLRGLRVYDLTPPFALCGDDLEMNFRYLIAIGNNQVIFTDFWGEDGGECNRIVETKDVDNIIVKSATGSKLNQASSMFDWYGESFKRRQESIFSKYLNA